MITFRCQNPNSCPRTFTVSDEHVGRRANCPVCEFRNTVPSAETVVLNNELSQIEAVLNECETKIKNGRHSIAVVKRRVQEIADPNEIMAWINARDVEKIEAYQKETLRVSEVDTIDITRLQELGHQHPNDPRVTKLGHRAADCYLNLSEIHLSASEELGGMNSSQKHEMLNATKELLSTMFPHWMPKSSVPPIISSSVEVPASKPQPLDSDIDELHERLLSDEIDELHDWLLSDIKAKIKKEFIFMLVGISIVTIPIFALLINVPTHIKNDDFTGIAIAVTLFGAYIGIGAKSQRLRDSFFADLCQAILLR